MVQMYHVWTHTHSLQFGPSGISCQAWVASWVMARDTKIQVASMLEQSQPPNYYLSGARQLPVSQVQHCHQQMSQLLS